MQNREVKKTEHSEAISSLRILYYPNKNYSLLNLLPPMDLDRHSSAYDGTTRILIKKLLHLGC